MNCQHCGEPIERSELHYRFAIALEGEQLALDSGGTPSGDELSRLLAQLEAGPDDPSLYDDQVHWERSGVLCVKCRTVLVTFFNARLNG